MPIPGPLLTSSQSAAYDKSQILPITHTAPEDAYQFDATQVGAVLPIGAVNASEVDLGGSLIPVKLLGAAYFKKRTPVADTTYTVLPTDFLISYTSISASRVVTLPAPSAALAGLEIKIKDESGSATSLITITATPASGLIDGASSLVVVNAAYGHATLFCNGSAWFSV